MKLTAIRVFLLAWFAAAPAAQAQGDAATSDRLLACDALDNAAERLECFNRVVEGLKSPQAFKPEPEPDAMPAPMAEVPAPAPAPAPVAEKRAPAPAPDPDPVTVKAEPEPAAESRERNASGEARIERVWENHDGRFTVRLDNGEIWRETQGTRVGIPDVGASVEISRSLFGSYRMKIDGIPTIAWVRPRD